VKLSVVVPAFNEEKLLADSLRAIHEAMRVFEDAELIVCDNNSTDRTAEIARAAGAMAVFEPMNQISRARNTGARHATGDWLVFVDADSFPSADLFADMKRAIESGRCVGGGSTVIYGETLQGKLFVAPWNLLSRLTRWAAGAFMFCEAAAFREAGGFDEALFASEEIDLFRKLKRIARREGRSIVILHRYPLRSSDRKLRLYSWWDFWSFMAKMALTRGRTLRSRADCYPWYDGRR
jgi:glycosyltransferase involved in cell wall biosynthesis